MLVARWASEQGGRVDDTPRGDEADDGALVGLDGDESSHDELGELKEARLRRARGRTAFRASMKCGSKAKS